jgi:hypothetical protein
MALSGEQHRGGPIDAATQREGRGRRVTSSATSLTAQWTGFFLAPAVFFAHLQLAYVLVPWSCVTGQHAWLHVAGIASVLLALAGTALAWWVWGRESDGAESHEPTGQDGGPTPRARFVGVIGFVMGTMFSLLLAAQWVSAFFISPCQ